MNEEEVTEIGDAYFYMKSGTPRLIVPPHLAHEVIEELHKFGHYGHKRMMVLLSQFYYWPKMNKDVFQYVKYCNQCQTNKRVVVPPRKYMKLPRGFELYI